MNAVPSLVFRFVPVDAVIVCAQCGQPINVSAGTPLAVWGMTDAPLHREHADAYIRAQGWEPAIEPGINIYKPRVDEPAP